MAMDVTHTYAANPTEIKLIMDWLAACDHDEVVNCDELILLGVSLRSAFLLQGL